MAMTMKSLAMLLGLLRRTAIACAALIGSVTLLIALTFLWDLRLATKQRTLETDHQNLVAQMELAQSQIQTQERGNVFYERALRAGLVGPARREEWVQALITAYERLELKGSPGFKLRKPQLITLAATSNPGAAMQQVNMMPTQTPTASAGQQTLEVYGHTLEFKLSDVHEGEILAILGSLQSAYPDAQKSEGCRLSNPQSTGLTVECSIRFFNMVPPEPAAAAASMAAMVPSAPMGAP